MRSRRSILLLAVLALFVTACRGPAAAAIATATATASSARDDAITPAETELGTVLVDANGRTLYGFKNDSEGTSTCYDACATTWPPVSGEATPGPDLDADVFSTAPREDDTTQLVAGSWPLYTFSGDAAPGDVNGQGSGGVWFAVAPDGTLITDGEDGAGASEEARGGPASGEGAYGEQAGKATGLGEPVLTDSNGFTLYYFLNDEPGTSTCNDPCSTTWPPVTADEKIEGSGLDIERLAPITRDDGSEQLAFDGRPLYRYVDDVAPGDVNGQGVGDVWFAVAADGSEIGPEGVRIGSTDAGDVLIDGDGFTLYTFANDAEGTSACNDPCSETWPPVPGDTAIDTTSLSEDQFDVITREDGSGQLALRGQPLYRYVDDANPGDANGEGVGDVWFTVPADDVERADNGDDEDDGGRNGDGAGEDAGEVTAADTRLGPVLVDGSGRTLYAFTEDADGRSACYDACADTWTPVPGGTAVDGSAVAGETSTITREDGSSQLAIGKWPLYTFSGDAGPGDVNGQGSGGVWYAVAPDGGLYLGR